MIETIMDPKISHTCSVSILNCHLNDDDAELIAKLLHRNHFPQNIEIFIDTGQVISEEAAAEILNALQETVSRGYRIQLRIQGDAIDSELEEGFDNLNYLRTVNSYFPSRLFQPPSGKANKVTEISNKKNCLVM
jgi:hypothetical protein